MDKLHTISSPISSSTITPARRSLGLSRKFKQCTPLASPSLTPISNFSSPLLRVPLGMENDENFLKTPPVSCVTPQLPKSYPMSPLKQERANANTAKRLISLSLTKVKKEVVLKKKKLDFVEISPSIITESPPESQLELNLPVSSFDRCSSPVETMLSQRIPIADIAPISEADIQQCNAELASELREIEILKQRDLRRRLESGLKVKKHKFKTIFKSPLELFKDEENIPMSQLPPEMSFKSARTLRYGDINGTSNGWSSANSESATTATPKSHQETVDNLKEIIATWKRGLFDAAEYYSCLFYPPTQFNDVLQHFNIDEELIADMTKYNNNK